MVVRQPMSILPGCVTVVKEVGAVLAGALKGLLAAPFGDLAMVA